MLCKVADHIFSIDVSPDCPGWDRLVSHYAPFVTEATGNILIDITISVGDVLGGCTAAMDALYTERPKDPRDTWLRAYVGTDGMMVFEIQQPRSPHTDARVTISADCRKSVITIDPASSQSTATDCITQGILLSYMLAATPHHTLLSHAACVVCDGRAYLFIAPSGTGKSTHARMWLSAIDGAFLLNDDHPVVRIGDDGVARAYGSPWSGKTDCYVDDMAPIGAIVRIVQAPESSIRLLQPMEAYASLTASFSGFTWIRSFADGRHAAIERLVMSTPCYTLQCRPDTDAAILCHTTVTNS